MPRSHFWASGTSVRSRQGDDTGLRTHKAVFREGEDPALLRRVVGGNRLACPAAREQRHPFIIIHAGTL
eukprot:5451314-Alexandrium_andersonii.AAC.1